MHAGRIEQEGLPEELYEHPRTQFVAGFLGVSNLLDATVTGVADGLVELILADGTVVRAPLAGDRSAGSRPAGTFRVGVRPEKVRLVADPASTPRPGDNLLEGTIVDASYVGVSTQYSVRVGERLLTVYAQNSDTRAGDSLAAGRTVRLAWDPRHSFIVASGGQEELEDA